VTENEKLSRWPLLLGLPSDAQVIAAMLLREALNARPTFAPFFGDN
jgi:hypothetical protein